MLLHLDISLAKQVTLSLTCYEYRACCKIWTDKTTIHFCLAVGKIVHAENLICRRRDRELQLFNAKPGWHRLHDCSRPLHTFLKPQGRAPPNLQSRDQTP